MKNTDEMLIQAARNASKNAYSPYSGFCVGAALLCENGKIYEGCNVENAAFSPTCCAERVAVFKAVSEGNTSFCAIAIVGYKKGEAEKSCYPCGVCRQVLSEFASKDFRVILYNPQTNGAISYTLGELLPNVFDF